MFATAAIITGEIVLLLICAFLLLLSYCAWLIDEYAIMALFLALFTVDLYVIVLVALWLVSAV